MRTITKWLATILLLGLLFANYPANAHAAFEAAPDSIVRAAQQPHAPRAGTVQRRAWIICQSFQYRLCRPALNVAWCEGTYRGIRLNPAAVNGQYQGVFQMGEHERRTYGHGPNVWAQAPAARRLWNHRHWTPWSCRPWPWT